MKDYKNLISSLKNHYNIEYLKCNKNSSEYIFYKKIYDVLDLFSNIVPIENNINIITQVKYSIAYMLYHDPLYESLITKIKQSVNNNQSLFYLKNLYINKQAFNEIVDIMNDYKNNNKKLDINNLSNKKCSDKCYDFTFSIIGIIGLTSIICSIGGLYSKNISFFNIDKNYFNIGLLGFGIITFLLSFYFIYKKQYKSIQNKMNEFEEIIVKHNYSNPITNNINKNIDNEPYLSISSKSNNNPLIDDEIKEENPIVNNINKNIDNETKEESPKPIKTQSIFRFRSKEKWNNMVNDTDDDIRPSQDV